MTKKNFKQWLIAAITGLPEVPDEEIKVKQIKK